MFSTTFNQAAAGSLAAIALSVASLSLVATPVHASTSVADWQAQANHSIKQQLVVSPVRSDELRAVEVAVRFDATGRFADAAVTRSSGDVLIDREALRTARHADFPLLPNEAQGRTVKLQLFFGNATDFAANDMPRTAAH